MIDLMFGELTHYTAVVREPFFNLTKSSVTFIEPKIMMFHDKTIQAFLNYGYLQIIKTI